MAFFDIGYARDMTALVSAMVAAAFDEKANPQSVLNVNRNIDPNGYFKSRLVGRSAPLARTHRTSGPRDV